MYKENIVVVNKLMFRFQQKQTILKYPKPQNVCLLFSSCGPKAKTKAT